MAELKPPISHEELTAALRDIDRVNADLNLHESFKQADRIRRGATLLLDCALERDIRHRYDENSLFYYFWLVDSTWRLAVFGVAFFYMSVLPFYEAPCRPWGSIIAAENLRTCPTESYAMIVEVGFILPLLWADCILRYRATGTVAFFALKWNIAMLLALLVCSVDAFGAGASPQNPWSHPRFLRIFRSVLAMASSKHSREAASDGLWVVVNMAGFVYGTVLFTSIWAAVGFAMIGNLGTRVTTDNFPNSYGTFNTMLTLMTANNWPDVQIPYYRLSPFFMIYFDLIIFIAYYAFVNGIIPGLVGVIYHDCLLMEAKHQFYLERNILLVVFASAQDEGQVGTTLSKDQLLKIYLELARLWQQSRWLQKLRKKLQPSFRIVGSDPQANSESAMRIYSGIDKDGGGTVDVKEFVDFARDATDAEVLRNFQPPTEIKDENLSHPIRHSYRVICSSPCFMVASMLLAMCTLAFQFQILELLLVLEVPFQGHLRAFWYVDWLLLGLAGVELAIIRFARGRLNPVEHGIMGVACTGKLVAELVITLHDLVSGSEVPLYPMVRASGYGPLLRCCFMMRIVGIVQLFGVIPASLETIGLFAQISKDMGRLISCILALVAVFSNVGQHLFLGAFSADLPALQESAYGQANYYDFAHFDSWLAAFNSVFYITVDNNWNLQADAAALGTGYNASWVYFTIIYFTFGSVVTNIFLCMFMELYQSVHKEKKKGGLPVVSSMSVTHRMIRDEVRADCGIED